MEFQIIDDICTELSTLEQTNAILGFIQTAFAEGAGLHNTKETSASLYHVYMVQAAAIEKIKKSLKEKKV